MGDANREIAFGAVAGAVLGALTIGSIAHLAGAEEPLVWAGVGGLGAGLATGATIWKAEKVPGSWANPILTETVPATASTPASTNTVVANPVPPTALGTTVSVLDVLGGLGAAAAAIGLFIDWQRNRI